MALPEFNETDNFFTGSGYVISYNYGFLLVDKNARKWAVIGENKIYDIDGIKDVQITSTGRTGKGEEGFITDVISVEVDYDGKCITVPVLTTDMKYCILYSERYNAFMEIAEECRNALAWFAFGGGKK